MTTPVTSHDTALAAPSAITSAVRAGIATDREHGAVVPPIHLSSTFAFAAFNQPRTFDYTRSGNPTRSQLADALAALELGTRAIVTNTGMSAVTLVLQLLKPGDVLVASHDCYGGTHRLLRALSARGHFTVVFADLTDDSVEATLGAHAPAVVWVETPSNPLLRITDIARVADASRRLGALVVVDNTFLSPALQSPITLGADVVVHSTTKYLNGHSDVVGGAVIARDAAVGDDLAWWANALGVTGAPFDSFLTLRGVRTLHARMDHHLRNADAVVAALRSHSAVSRVHYPGLASHPGHEIAARQQRGFGAMVSFELAGGALAAEQLAGSLQYFTLAESLGGVESLIAHPATMTHASMDAAARANAGISDGLLRLSVGIESPADLVVDLTRALDLVARARPAASRPRSRPAAKCDATDVVLLGAGAIGRELLEQLAANSEGRARVCGVIDRSGCVFDADGLAPGRVRELAALKRKGQPLAEALDGVALSPSESVALAVSQRLNHPILVDVTAADTSAELEHVLDRGWNVVLANKAPLTASQPFADALHAAARRGGGEIRYEATVGAGLPVVDTLSKLLESGDEVLAIEGCPSGTLGYLFGELGRGATFSEALRNAMGAGYTEPDPRIDLSGLDVARKALILSRALGNRSELSDIPVESLIPSHLARVPLEEFLSRAHELDDDWHARVAGARSEGAVLRYRARVTRGGISVGLVAVPLGDPLANLSGTDNQFSFTTTRYLRNPLVITGPGAGSAVTAAGVLNDILRVAGGWRARVEVSPLVS